MSSYKFLFSGIIVILLLAAISVVADIDNKQDTSVNETMSKSNTINETAANLNETNKSAGPVSISLEKPPFIE
ncbi:hypothetical protein RE476_04360 [Methanolobus mangrovi]|uniref:Uncharacterized protein n=1 Tax=Methanolobus mangrovi TaxID=3072977 RepID=A0AA51UH41_9EURY|nr:hypothetical protein [Methanolobus mangrovi]WMW23070.1 hypothetical protein RE476_04360 [Methanolobus mangrovi]